MNNLGGYNGTQAILWGDQDSWHLVANGPVIGFWKGPTFLGNQGESLARAVAYVTKYHSNKESI